MFKLNNFLENSPNLEILEIAKIFSAVPGFEPGTLAQCSEQRLFWLQVTQGVRVFIKSQ
jgi:hypothetical protein